MADMCAYRPPVHTTRCTPRPPLGQNASSLGRSGSSRRYTASPADTGPVSGAWYGNFSWLTSSSPPATCTLWVWLRGGAGHWVTSTGRDGSVTSSTEVPAPVVPVWPTYSASPCRMTCMPSPWPPRPLWPVSRSPAALAVRALLSAPPRFAPTPALPSPPPRFAPTPAYLLTRAPSFSAAQSAVRYRWNGARLAQPWLPLLEQQQFRLPARLVHQALRLLPGDEPVELAHDGQQRAA